MLPLRFSFLCCALLLAPIPVFSQKENGVGWDLVNRILERVQEQSQPDVDQSDLREQLLQTYQNKLNLNRASREDLNALVFLQPGQIEAIIRHREIEGDFISIYEL